MNVALEKLWTVETFLNWAAQQEERYEFDGLQPVAMTGGSARHNRISQNLYAALRSRLRGSPCSHFGPDLGVQTLGNAVRYPDALITCTKFLDTERLAPNVRVVFEILSPDSGRRDRIEKVREYAVVATITRYIIVESTSIGVLVLHRQTAGAAFTALPLTADDMLELPEANIGFPVAELYEDITFLD